MKQSIVNLFVSLGLDSSLEDNEKPSAVEAYKGRGYSPERPAIAADSIQTLTGLLADNFDSLEPAVIKDALTELASCGQDSWGRGRIFY